MYKRTGIILILMMVFNCLSANEGFWLLIGDNGKLYDLLKLEGLLLSREQVSAYRNNMVFFEGGVPTSGTILSEKGLVATSARTVWPLLNQNQEWLQRFSSNGFWAEEKDREIPVDGLRAYRIIPFTLKADTNNYKNLTVDAIAFRKNEYLRELSRSYSPRRIINEKVNEIRARLDAKFLPEIEQLQQKITPENRQLLSKSELLAIEDKLKSLNQRRKKIEGALLELQEGEALKSLETVVLPIHRGLLYMIALVQRFEEVSLVGMPTPSLANKGINSDFLSDQCNRLDYCLLRINDLSINNRFARIRKIKTETLYNKEAGKFVYSLSYPGETQRYATTSELASAYREAQTNELLISVKINELQQQTSPRFQNDYRMTLYKQERVQAGKMLDSLRLSETNFHQLYQQTEGGKDSVELFDPLELMAPQMRDYIQLRSEIGKFTRYLTLFDAFKGIRYYDKQLPNHILYDNYGLRSTKEFRLFQELMHANFDRQDKENIQKLLNELYVDLNVKLMVDTTASIQEKLEIGNFVLEEDSMIYKVVGHHHFVKYCLTNSAFLNKQLFKKYEKRPDKYSMDQDILYEFYKRLLRHLASLQAEERKLFPVTSVYVARYMQHYFRLMNKGINYPDGNSFNNLRFLYGRLGAREVSEKTIERQYSEEGGDWDRWSNRYQFQDRPLFFSADLDFHPDIRGGGVFDGKGKWLGIILDGSSQSRASRIHYNKEAFVWCLSAAFILDYSKMSVLKNSSLFLELSEIKKLR